MVLYERVLFSLCKDEQGIMMCMSHAHLRHRLIPLEITAFQHCNYSNRLYGINKAQLRNY